MPTLARVPLADIDEPAQPVRCSMDEVKMAELVASMRTLGLLQPIGLKRLPLGAHPTANDPIDGFPLEAPASFQRYEIEFGHRRFIAATQLRWRDIPAMIFDASELQEGAAMIAENSHREDVNAAEEGLLFAQAQERYTLDEAGLMKRFNVSQDYLGDRMRLVREGGKVFDALLKREISFTVARELNKCADLAQREYFLDCAIRGGTGSRVVAQWIRDWRLQASPPSSPAVALTPATDAAVDASNPLACFICGGSKDPWALESVYIHKREKADIIAALQKAAEV
jgi:ParB/RepB/Spo0J family partition protein